MKTNLRFTALLLGQVALAALPAAQAQTSNIGAGNQYAWGANSGWVDFIPNRPNAGDGIRVTDRFLSGYAWSANTGWIHFGDGTPANGTAYANTSNTDYGVNHDGAGNLSGLAWSANTGWINFGWADSTNENRPRFELVSGTFTGYAWSANLGWISLNTGMLKTDSMIVTDSDGDGISDSWELGHTNSLPVLTASGDVDGDGITDKQEYILDTNPLVPNSPFAITRITSIPNLSYVEIEWPSSPARIYGLEYRTNLVADNWVFALNVPGAANTNATTVPVTGTLPQVFMRLQAKLPLQP